MPRATAQGDVVSEIDGSAVASLRRLNGTKVLDVLRAEAYRKFTVREMAVATGLSRPTVARLLEDFATARWALSEEGRPGATGRPARRYWFDRTRGLIVSIDLGPRARIVMLSDLVGTELAFREDLAIDLGAPETIIPDSLAVMDELLATLPDVPAVAGVCLAAPVLFSDDGEVLSSRVMPHLVGSDIGAQLREAFQGVPLVVNNDQVITTEAEIKLGALKNSVQGMYINAGAYTSVALTRNGSVHEGHRRSAGDIGALAEYAWQSKLDAAFEAAHPGETTSVSRLIAGDREGHAEDTAALDQFARGISRGVCDLAAAWDPDVVVIGGYLARSDAFFEPLRQALLEFGADTISVRREQLDAVRSAGYGGILRVLDAIDWSA